MNTCIRVAIIMIMTAVLNAADNTKSDVLGRDDPFAELPVPIQVQQIIQPETQAAAEGTEPIAPQPILKPELFVETIVVKFLAADNLKVVLSKMSSPFGTIAVDKTSNSLIICDTNDTLQKIMTEIKKVDKTPQLLDIEVVIVDVQLDNDTEIGVNWDMLSTERNHLGLRQNLTSRLGSTIEDAATIGNATAFNSTGLGTDVSIVTGTVRSVIHMLQAKRKVEIIASPRVLLVSGKAGSVEAVEEIPYQEQTQTSQGGQLASTQFKQVGIKLAVTATIADDNQIVMLIEPEQNTNTGTFGIANIPIIDTRRARANLMLKDSEVVIMGGLRRKEQSKIREQVPVLGDIPVLGFLFGRDKVVTVNSELMVFISPHIYKDKAMAAEDIAKYSQVKALPKLPIFNGENKK